MKLKMSGFLLERLGEKRTRITHVVEAKMGGGFMLLGYLARAAAVEQLKGVVEEYRKYEASCGGAPPEPGSTHPFGVGWDHAGKGGGEGGEGVAVEMVENPMSGGKAGAAGGFV